MIKLTCFSKNDGPEAIHKYPKISQAMEAASKLQSPMFIISSDTDILEHPILGIRKDAEIDWIGMPNVV